MGRSVGDKLRSLSSKYETPLSAPSQGQKVGKRQRLVQTTLSPRKPFIKRKVPSGIKKPRGKFFIKKNNG